MSHQQADPAGQSKPPCKVIAVPPGRIAGTSAKVELRLSPVHGYGVFAIDAIEPGELIEELRLLKLGWRTRYPADPVVKDYTWRGPKCDCIECREHGPTCYLALGLGSMYNHQDEPNTRQSLDFQREVMRIWAERPIEKDEEIFITYGDKYFLIRDFWKNIKKNNDLERAALRQRKADQERGASPENR